MVDILERPADSTPRDDSPAGQAPTLSIVVPAFNEAAGIAGTLVDVDRYLAASGVSAEIIVVDDGSRDGTAAAARSVATAADFRVLRNARNRGKGYSVRRGLQLARGRFVGFIDADNKTPIDQVGAVLPMLEAGVPIVIGSRALSGAQIERRQPLHRRLGSRAFGALLHRATGLHEVPDTQCGFKFYRADVARLLFSRTFVDGPLFDVEHLWCAERLGIPIRQVPVRWRDDGDSRFHPVTGWVRILRELLAIRRAHAGEKAENDTLSMAAGAVPGGRY